LAFPVFCISKIYLNYLPRYALFKGINTIPNVIFLTIVNGAKSRQKSDLRNNLDTNWNLKCTNMMQCTDMVRFIMRKTHIIS